MNILRMTKSFFMCVAVLSICLHLNGEESPSLSPEIVFKRLQEGNQRYVKGQLLHPNRDQKGRDAVTAKQTPYAIILGCSDSRVSPEIVFDEGIGDLFIVRVAGNVVGPIELDSIEYASINLGSRGILVLGHENCGAIKAVMAGQSADIEAIMDKIEPVIKGIDRDNKNALEMAVKANVLAVVEQLKKSSKIAKLVETKQSDVRGAYYHLSTGVVEMLD